MSRVRWFGRSGPRCRINKICPADRTLGGLVGFPEPFIEAPFVKNMITRERADLVHVLNTLQTDGTNPLINAKRKEGFTSKACLMKEWMLTISLAATSVARPDFLYLRPMIAMPAWKFPWELP